MSFLLGTAEDGSGSAALTSKRLPDRIPRRVRNLIVASAVGAIVAVGVAQIFFRQPTKVGWSDPAEAPAPFTHASASAIPTPITSGSPTPPPPTGTTREYAVDVSDLLGLPPDVQPGQVMEIWVAWDPAVTKGPQIQRLLKVVTLQRFVEPVTMDGPRVAVLSVPRERIGDLMYGDMFGSLTVTLEST